ncbi:hypothetical protein EAWG_03087 [Escherichia coli TA008]|nr:hypothetical protein EAWG_03087 [Escherichia coli TA008]
MLLDALFRSKSLENPSTPITGDAVDTDGLFRADVYVSPETAMKLAAVYSCNLSVIEESKLELVSAVRYSAQYVPMFTLTLDKKEITMPKNTVIFPFASDETAKYLNEQQQKYKDSLFLTR